jgi:Lipopolysaccharide-assembly
MDRGPAPGTRTHADPDPGSRTRRRRLAMRALVLALLTLPLAGCLYHLSGGGGFPSDVHTIYIAPFDNQTDQFQVGDELFKQLLDQIPKQLGVQVAGKGVADATLTGKITHYDDAAQNYVPNQTTSSSQTSSLQVLQHEVDIVVSVQIVDVKRNVILWESTALTGKGQYAPSTQTDVDGRALAIKNLVDQIVNGALSQW